MGSRASNKFWRRETAIDIMFLRVAELIHIDLAIVCRNQGGAALLPKSTRQYPLMCPSLLEPTTLTVSEALIVFR